MKNLNTKKVISFLVNHLPDLKAVYLYGSAVGDAFNKESDLDIAIKTNSEIGQVRRWEFQEKLAVEMGRDVDLLDLDQASLVMKYEVVTTGERIFCNDIEQIEEYETLTYSLYLDFNQIRKPIIEAVLDRRSVYGDG